MSIYGISDEYSYDVLSLLQSLSGTSTNSTSTSTSNESESTGILDFATISQEAMDEYNASVEKEGHRPPPPPPPSGEDGMSTGLESLQYSAATYSSSTVASTYSELLAEESEEYAVEGEKGHRPPPPPPPSGDEGVMGMEGMEYVASAYETEEDEASLLDYLEEAEAEAAEQAEKGHRPPPPPPPSDNSMMGMTGTDDYSYYDDFASSFASNIFTNSTSTMYNSLQTRMQLLGM